MELPVLPSFPPAQPFTINALGQIVFNQLPILPGGSSIPVGPVPPVVTGDLVAFADTSGFLLADSGKAPPAGAIVGTTDVQALTNKSYEGNTWTAGTGTLTIGAGKTLNVQNSLAFSGVDGKGLTIQNAIVLAGVDGKGLTINNSLILAGTDGTTMTFPSVSGRVLTTAGSVLSTTKGTPAGTTSGAGVMMGLGDTWKITPLLSTRILVGLTGYITNNTGGDGGNVRIAFGTGAAPANGAAFTGTVIGQAIIAAGLTVANAIPFALFGIVSGLTAGVQVWLDAVLAISGGGTATLNSPSFFACEI